MNASIRRRRTWTAAAALVVGMALLAACGDAGTSASTTSASTSSAQPTKKPGAAATKKPGGATAKPSASSEPSSASNSAPSDPVDTGKPTSVTTLAGGGQVPVINRIDTKDPVVFLTIDDGYIKPSEFQTYITQRQIPLTMFLVSEAVGSKASYFNSLASVPGSSIQNHSVNHANLKTLSAAGQRAQICGNADKEQKLFGTRPTLLRPPYGAYNETTRAVARSCGMKALVLWSASMPSNKLYYGSGSKLKAGDIILLHFRSTGSVRNMNKLLGIIDAQGLKVASLTDYLK